ncbi:uncharacterized protein EI90DRAFT_3057928 [Cantharellus anzutake]|uniref:uncharacterized protein n=1 Tax=Cantharellus anzutake TaxID=1750568 RepID=UPI001902CFA0|nr:uncharacterized protein EI90DRAFT_3057928 [Cantharellus anzutake]KAF8331434.1 hypothetical protein EI90DRAFT_3057928 [Cantharellus anzutake]
MERDFMYGSGDEQSDGVEPRRRPFRRKCSLTRGTFCGVEKGQRRQPRCSSYSKHTGLKHELRHSIFVVVLKSTGNLNVTLNPFGLPMFPKFTSHKSIPPILIPFPPGPLPRLCRPNPPSAPGTGATAGMGSPKNDTPRCSKESVELMVALDERGYVECHDELLTEVEDFCWGRNAVD